MMIETFLIWRHERWCITLLMNDLNIMGLFFNVRL